MGKIIHKPLLLLSGLLKSRYLPLNGGCHFIKASGHCRHLILSLFRQPSLQVSGSYTAGCCGNLLQRRKQPVQQGEKAQGQKKGTAASPKKKRVFQFPPILIHLPQIIPRLREFPLHIKKQPVCPDPAHSLFGCRCFFHVKYLPIIHIGI